MSKPHLIIISPALEQAHNGNWQTAHRWAHFLRTHYRVTLATHWDGASCDAMIALHARRSATSIAAFAAAYPALPLIVVLTGTDLYRDIQHDEDAQRSLQLATRLVVLQAAGLQELSPVLRSKASVIHQSAPVLKPVKKPARHFAVMMIGHLRDEKDPVTFMRAVAHLQSAPVRLIHIGNALDPALGAEATATQAAHHQYRWLGNVPHAVTRQRLKRSHLMVITSSMEGGANVIVEALSSDVPVIASDISGNRGMLGADYEGYFPLGDSAGLAAAIDRAASNAKFYARLQQQCAARKSLFTPQQERVALLQLVNFNLETAIERA